MKVFPEQLTLTNFFSDLFFALAAVTVLLVILGLGLVDMSLVRRKNVVDTWVQKIVASTVAGIGMFLGGYGLWVGSFNAAFGIPNPVGEGLKDWWLGGHFTNTVANFLDPKVVPQADVQQIFLVFFITFTMAGAALIHSGTLERMKPLPLYIMMFVFGAVFAPLINWLVWGPLGPLSNHGTHDFEGVMTLYIFAGAWVLALSWRLGPRLGAFAPHPRGTAPAAHNIGLAAMGVLIIMFALPLIGLGSGFLIPGTGFFGISFTTSGVGIVLINIFAAFLGGGLMGALIGYRRREPVWVLLGPLAGAVMCGTLFDIGKPWYVFLIAMLGPIVALGTARLVRRAGIDEPKVVPLALGPGIVGTILCGFVNWGTRTAGYPGLTGHYALQHATITPWWQLLGVLATVALSGGGCLVLCFVLERTIGLRVSEEQEIQGMDQTYWGIDNFGSEPRELGLAADDVPLGAEPLPSAT